MPGALAAAAVINPKLAQCSSPSSTPCLARAVLLTQGQVFLILPEKTLLQQILSRSTATVSCLCAQTVPHGYPALPGYALGYSMALAWISRAGCLPSTAPQHCAVRWLWGCPFSAGVGKARELAGRFCWELWEAPGNLLWASRVSQGEVQMWPRAISSPSQSVCGAGIQLGLAQRAALARAQACAWKGQSERNMGQSSQHML